MTGSAMPSTASVIISIRLRSVIFDGGTMAFSPPCDTADLKASAPMVTNSSTIATANTCVSENADGKACTPASVRAR